MRLLCGQNPSRFYAKRIRNEIENKRPSLLIETFGPEPEPLPETFDTLIHLIDHYDEQINRLETKYKSEVFSLEQNNSYKLKTTKRSCLVNLFKAKFINEQNNKPFFIIENNDLAKINIHEEQIPTIRRGSFKSKTADVLDKIYAQDREKLLDLFQRKCHVLTDKMNFILNSPETLKILPPSYANELFSEQLINGVRDYNIFIEFTTRFVSEEARTNILFDLLEGRLSVAKPYYSTNGKIISNILFAIINKHKMTLFKVFRSEKWLSFAPRLLQYYILHYIHIEDENRENPPSFNYNQILYSIYQLFKCFEKEFSEGKLGYMTDMVNKVYPMLPEEKLTLRTRYFLSFIVSWDDLILNNNRLSIEEFLDDKYEDHSAPAYTYFIQFIASIREHKS